MTVLGALLPIFNIVLVHSNSASKVADLQLFRVADPSENRIQHFADWRGAFVVQNAFPAYALNSLLISLQWAISKRKKTSFVVFKFSIVGRVKIIVGA